MEFTVTKQVTKRLLKLENDVPAYVRIVSKFFVGKNIEAKAGEKKKEAPNLVDVVNLDAPKVEGRKEEVMEMIVNAVLKSKLAENYPNDSYVGKCFEVTKHDKSRGKEYNDFSLNEISVGPAKGKK